MHCQITDRYFNVFFVEIQLTKQNLKSDIWVSEFGQPNWYTGLPNGLYTSLKALYLYRNSYNTDIVLWCIDWSCIFAKKLKQILNWFPSFSYFACFTFWKLKEAGLARRKKRLPKYTDDRWFSETWNYAGMPSSSFHYVCTSNLLLKVSS